MKMLIQRVRPAWALFFLLFLACLSLGRVQAQGNSVTLCHDGHTISVSVAAAGHHLLHGDVLGPCCIDPRLINPQCVCPAVYAPVCGCNGVTYSNGCLASCSGVTSWTQGPCELCVGPPQQLICPAVYDPVCGCDGNTYSNSCYAMAAGVLIWVPGECGSIGVGKRAEGNADAPSLAPNPSQDRVAITWTPAVDGQAQLKVMDVQGKVVFQTALAETGGGKNTYTLDVVSWDAGVYIVQVTSGSKATNLKLLVTH
jgi:hypothetical protein